MRVIKNTRKNKHILPKEYIPCRLCQGSLTLNYIQEYDKVAYKNYLCKCGNSMLIPITSFVPCAEQVSLF